MTPDRFQAACFFAARTSRAVSLWEEAGEDPGIDDDELGGAWSGLDEDDGEELALGFDADDAEDDEEDDEEGDGA
jgi:hypothetical protein